MSKSRRRWGCVGNAAYWTFKQARGLQYLDGWGRGGSRGTGDRAGGEVNCGGIVVVVVLND